MPIKLSDLQSPSDYVTARSHLWPSMWSWEWWKRSQP